MNNFIHLDFKGIIPSTGELKRYLKWFSLIGFNGVVLEYDCRLAWKSWQGAGSPAYSMKDVKEIGEYIHELGMECVPLIQSIGHLGWALYEDQFSHLRENGEYTELCPLHPEALPKIMSWIDEAVELHPHCRYIHLGADESTHLGSCPECRAAADPADPLKNYLAHISKLCSHAIAAGKRPMIWSDMLWKNPESAKRLPPETILVNWQYRGDAPFPHTQELKKNGMEVWGASALQCMYPGYEASCMSVLQDRMKNVKDWQNSGLDMIHTTWGRPNNFWTLYPPWAGLIPVFAEAGGVENADAGKHFFQMFEQWQKLSGQLEELKKEFHFLMDSKYCRQTVFRRFGCVEGFVEEDHEKQMEQLTGKLRQWKNDTADFFKTCQLSEAEEFIASRTEFFKYTK